MTIYVDSLRAVKPSRQWPFPHAAHMIADSLPELHAFAKKIGLRRAWFQGDGTFPHYDLTERRHALAVRFGATLISRTELALVMRRIRSEKEGSNDGQAQR